MKKDSSDIGFELNINGKTISAPINGKSVINIVFTKLKNDLTEVRFGGMNESLELLDYYDYNMTVGEVASIEFKQMSDFSVPVNRGTLKCGVYPPTDEEELSRYYQLKKELESEGLI